MPTTKAAAGTHTSWFELVYGKYVPFTVRERFAIDSNPGGPLKAAEMEIFEGQRRERLWLFHQPRVSDSVPCAGAVSFVDISGFTKLSEFLVRREGRGGAELLNKFISGYFLKLIEVVFEFGGDILKFAGDAMLVVWRNPQTERIGMLVAFWSSSRCTLFTSHSLAGENGERQPRARRARKTTQKDLTKLLGKGEDTLAALTLRAIACNLTLLKVRSPPFLLRAETFSQLCVFVWVVCCRNWTTSGLPPTLT